MKDQSKRAADCVYPASITYLQLVFSRSSLYQWALPPVLVRRWRNTLSLLCSTISSRALIDGPTTDRF